MSILNTKFELAFACRDFNAACRYLDLLIKYTNLGLSDMRRLLSGLMVYDKVMIEMYAASVRRLLKMTDLLESSDKLTNINIIDKEFVLGDEEKIINTLNSKEPSVLSFQKTLKHYDDWFNNNSESLELFKTYYENDYQQTKNSPDFSIDGIITAQVNEYKDGEIKTQTFDVYPFGTINEVPTPGE